MAKPKKAKKLTNDERLTEEDLSTLQGILGRLEVGHVLRAVLSLRWPVFCSLVGFVLVVFSAGFSAHPLWQRISEGSNEGVAAERQKPRNINIETFEFGSDSESAWETPIWSYLESEAESEIENDMIADYVNLRIETCPFEGPTSQFRLRILPFADCSLAGYVYRVHHLPGDTHNRHEDSLLQLFHVFHEEGASLVDVPKCEQGDSLVLLIRVSGKSNLPTSVTALRDQIKIEME